MCVGASAIQTSVSQAITSKYFKKVFLVGNAETNPALHPLNRLESSLYRLASMGT